MIVAEIVLIGLFIILGFLALALLGVVIIGAVGMMLDYLEKWYLIKANYTPTPRTGDEK